MRSWYLSRIALERRFEQHPEQPYGVYDRRPSPTMFFARLVSACLALCVFVFGLATAGSRQNTHGAYGAGESINSTYIDDSPQYDDMNNSIIPDPKGIRIVASDGTELVYQRISADSLGTVLMLHGCSHSATDFFPPGEHCPECLGLPQEVHMTKIALRKQYDVLAVSSTDRKRKCWDTKPHTGLGPDYDRVETALREAEVRGAYSLSKPLFAVGLSSGGLFATSLPMQFKIAGVNSVISSAACLYWSKSKALPSKAFPPHVFTHMSTRDKGTAHRVQEAMNKLKSFGTAVKELTVEPKVVTTAYLSKAVPRWDSDLVAEVVSALRQGEILDERNQLRSDPRHSYWRNSVQHLKSRLGDSFVADASALSEELNRAWGVHEATSEYFQETLEFLEDNLHV